jgi:hypothetical protein
VTTLVGAELLKLRTTRAWIGYLGVLVLFSVLGTASQIGSAPEFELADPDFSRVLLEIALVAGLVAFLMGIMSVTVEWRHGTITRTLLVTPRRERVLAAKVIWALLLGVALALLAIAIVLAIGVPWLSAEGYSFELDGDVLGLIGRMVLAAALWGALGVAFGTLIQNQAAALVVGLLWILLLEALIVGLLGLVDAEGVGDFLPGRALAALEGEVEDGLSPWAGAGVAVAWIAVLNGLGHQRFAREDVT